MSEEQTIDFLAVGDIVTDAFIRVKNASVECDMDKESYKLCFSFGDKIPYEYVDVIRAVGNSPNASVSAARLGLNSALVADVGDDEEGEKCVATVKEQGVRSDYLRVHEGFETNYHYVLWYEDERTILVKHQEYSYEWPEFDPAPRWIYLSSLAENSLSYHDMIAEYLKQNPEVKLAFQPGTFQMRLGYERLKELYQLSTLFFCNVEEAKRILGIKDQIELVTLLEKMHELGPEITVITDGPRGAYAYHEGEAWFMPPYPDPAPPHDRTGAGDSFASTMTSFLALGESIPEALRRAPINSMSVVQETGAQRGLLSKEKLEEYLAQAPEDYIVQKVQ